MSSLKTRKNRSFVRKKLIKSRKIKLTNKPCKKTGKKCGNKKTKTIRIRKNKNKNLKKGGADEEYPECSICMEPILPAQQVYYCANQEKEGKNRHVFHIGCIREYCNRVGRYQFKCPLCRVNTPCPDANIPPLPDGLNDLNIYFYGDETNGAARHLDRQQIIENFFEHNDDEIARRRALNPNMQDTMSYIQLLSQERHGNEDPHNFYNGGEQYTEAETDEILNNIGTQSILLGGNEYTTYVDERTHYYIALNRYDDAEVMRNIWNIYGPGGVVEANGEVAPLRSREAVNRNPPRPRTLFN